MKSYNTLTTLKRGVFTTVTGLDGNGDQIQKFINEKHKVEDPRLKKYKDSYEKKTEKLKKQLDELSKLEEIILQLRAKSDLKNIVLVLVNDYVYARGDFYRSDKKIKDIRVIIDKVSSKEEFDKLPTNKKFMALANTKLREAMETEIERTIKNLSEKI